MHDTTAVCFHIMFFQSFLVARNCNSDVEAFATHCAPISFTNSYKLMSWWPASHTRDRKRLINPNDINASKWWMESSRWQRHQRIQTLISIAAIGMKSIRWCILKLRSSRYYYACEKERKRERRWKTQFRSKKKNHAFGNDSFEIGIFWHSRQMAANGKMLQSRPIARTIKETINRMLERTCAGIYLFSSLARRTRCAIRLIVCSCLTHTQFHPSGLRLWTHEVFFSFKKWKMCFLFTNYDVSIVKIIINSINIIISIIVFVLFSSSFESHILWRSQTIRGKQQYAKW